MRVYAALYALIVLTATTSADTSDIERQQQQQQQQEDNDKVFIKEQANTDASTEPDSVTNDGSYEDIVITWNGNIDSTAHGGGDDDVADVDFQGESLPEYEDTVWHIVDDEAERDEIIAAMHGLATENQETAPGDRLHATLEEVFTRIAEQGELVLEDDMVEGLQQLFDDAVAGDELSDDEFYEKYADLFYSAQDAVTAAVDAALESSIDPMESPEPTDAFLAVEDRVLAEGYTQELLEELRKLVTEQDDLFALEKLAYLELFEPFGSAGGSTTSTSKNWTNLATAFTNLRRASDAGVTSATGTLAMLNLIDFGVPRNASLSRQERHRAAERVLLSLEKQDDFMAALAMGYRYLSGKTQGFLTDRCENAVMYYHRCAEANVYGIAELGVEKSMDVVRLSQEWTAPDSITVEQNEDVAHQFEYYRSVADNPGDEMWPEATQRLGELYFFGDAAAGIERNHALAAQYFQRAADAGEPVAQANYGMMVANGIGVAQNNVTAMKYFRAAAAQGNGFAMHGIGVMHLTGSGVAANETKALEYFQKAIDLGYTESHTYLGTAYLNGEGVAKNFTKAFEHFELATASKFSQSFFNLGVMYFRGVGTKRSCEKALDQFRIVALHPHLLSELPFSILKAYECYQKGDYLRAYLNYRLVAEFGDEDAQCNAAFLLEHFGGEILPLVSHLDDQNAKDNGESVLWMAEPKKPLEEAYHLYMEASNLNDTEAIRKTGTCFHEPWEGVCTNNITYAMERYALAAELGDSEAAYYCGMMHTIGDGVEQDLQKAREYYAKCSEASFPGNVPCAIILPFVDIVLALRSMVVRIWG